MKRISSRSVFITVISIVSFLSVTTSADIMRESSTFDTELVKIKYNMSSYNSEMIYNQVDGVENSADLNSSESSKRKSPLKAFILSAAVPGLGQFYNGNKIKAAAFLGVEATAWIFNVKLNKDGDDITEEFHAFNDEHWSQTNYEDKYLLWTYGYSDDEDIPPGSPEISHHLPDTKTQQYYEMTGKYNQFSWGWDDANIDGVYIDDYSISNPPPTATTPSTTPYSANRLWYEDRRNDANNKYDAARRMVYVSLINRVISAFEALITANRMNNSSAESDQEFSSLKLNADLKSFNAYKDTPYLTMTLKF